MNPRLRFVCLSLVALIVPASAAAQTWGQFGVDVLPLPAPWGFARGSRAVNDAGHVVGRYYNGSFLEAFLWDGTTVQGLGTLGGSSSRATAINNAGQVTGYADLYTGTRAFLYSAGTMTDLGTVNGAAPGYRSAGAGINALGQVTGTSDPAGSSGTQAMFWDGTSMVDIGSMVPYGQSFGSDVNDLGQVTGDGIVWGVKREAFIYDGSTVLGLGTLGGNTSYGKAINNAGQVAGSSRTAAGDFEAFLYDGVAMIGLGTMGGTRSYAYGITDAGQVVGNASLSGGWERAVLWEGGTGHFLDALVGGGWTFRDAYTVSSGGTILALGTHAAVNGGSEGYVVLKQRADPSNVVPEPGTWVLLATGLIAVGVAARRRRETSEA